MTRAGEPGGATSPGHLAVLGYGYTAGFLGAALLSEGWRVSGTRRTAEAAAALSEEGVTGWVLHGEDRSPELGDVLAEASHLLVSIPPGAEGDVVLTHHEELIRRAGALRWVGLLSTTGVYGDRGGAWVDEDSPPDPGAPSTQRRLEAEEGWARLCRSRDVPFQCLRLPAIYGPGRSVVDRLREGRARHIVKPGLYFNRMHVEDIAGVIRAGMTRPHAGTLFNLSDDLPSPPEAPLRYAAELLGAALPEPRSPEEAGLGPMGLRFFSESKRVRNERMKDRLGYTLRHPTYREGLRAIAQR